MTHLKRINSPKSWPVHRKATKFITKQLPGPHRLEESMPIGVILKELLKLGKTRRQIKIILNNGAVLVNGEIRKDFRFVAGIMDSISILPLNKHYIILFNKMGKLGLAEINKGQSEEKICKVIGKTILKKGKVQLNLYGGKNLIVDKDTYKVKDSVVINNNKIVKHLKFGKGSIAYLTGGKNIGAKGEIIDVKKSSDISKATILLKIGNNTHETLADYAYIIEK